ncbi:prenyltransferase/squalene oxidase repeat-containing protein [Actinomadura sp. NTSP31]|uniref:prenyltransferase/squalene oxidase repeat-containing protein n=1 Tax=Actinomadura sp. NTSP31 TaxID=1735447 RepID=UPI0035BFB4B2
MSVQDEKPSEPRAAAAVSAPDLAERANTLVTGLLADPWGRMSPSVYETGRLVALAPWLTGHRERLGHLAGTQRPDGGWGAPGAYALVPTLSATDAILTELGGGASGTDRGVLARSAARGLDTLTGLLDRLTAQTVPDMPAVELISAYLTERINDRLAGFADSPSAGLGLRQARIRLRAPDGWNAELGRIRSLVGAGHPVPEKLLHALEIAGPAARRAACARPGPRTGGIGASPAATAAWLGADAPPPPADPARRFLERAAAQHGGPVPCGIPVTVFERAWVLSSLLRSAVPVSVPPALTASLATAIGASGTPAGEGLPADADTTSVALHALALLGSPHEPDSLLQYELPDHFCTWEGEQGASVTTNAHVLDAFGEFLKHRPDARARYAPSMVKAARWLQSRQHPDGSWTDRWHVSPYYATACAALALRHFGGVAAGGHVRRAEQWVLDGQRADGSWGWWTGTAEETAHAMLVLLSTAGRGPLPPRVRAAADRGRAWLLGAPAWTDGPALWHDKDLYLPGAIVEASVLSALHLAR